MKLRQLLTTLALAVGFTTAATAGTTKSWTKLCTDATYVAGAGTTAQYDKSQVAFVFEATMDASSLTSTSLMKYWSDNSNTIEIKTTAEGKFQIYIKRNGKTELTQDSTVSAEAGTHVFALKVRRGGSDYAQLVSVILYMDGTEIAKIVHGQDGRDENLIFAGNPIGNIQIGQSDSANLITLYRLEGTDGNVPTKADGYTTDTTDMAVICRDANVLFFKNDTDDFGNLGLIAGSGVTFTSVDRSGMANTYTIDFADDSNLCYNEIKPAGTLKLSALKLVIADTTPTMPTAATLSDGVTTVSSTGVSTEDGKLYGSGDLSYSRKITTFTFASDDTLDTSKKITLTLEGSWRGTCVKPINATVTSDNTWSPVFLVMGDYTPAKSIAVNFNSGSGTATADSGFGMAATWNNVSGASASGMALNYSDGTDSGATLTSSGNTWSWGSASDPMLKGYIDDNATISITVANIPFKNYDVIVYQATDTGNYGFNPPSINGTYYSYDGLTTSKTANDTALKYGVTQQKTAIYGKNTVYVRAGFTDSTLTIVGAGNSNSARGCIAGIQIVEAQAAPEYAATVDADTNWADIEWSPAAPEGGYEANAKFTLNVTGSPTITFTEAVAMTGMQTLTVVGTPVLKAADSVYENGCWEKTILTASTFTAEGATFADLKDGFAGAYTQTDTGFKLRGQNREVISINVGGGRNGGSGMDSDSKYLVPSNDTYYGLAPVKGETWNNINRKWKTSGLTEVTLKGSIAAQADGTLVSRPTIDLSAKAKETYSWDCNQPYLSGYLDDGQGVTVSVHGVPYTKYDVIVYATSDESYIGLAPMTVNGTKYTFKDGQTVVDTGTTSWGVGQCKDPAFGKNALYIKNLTGEELTIVSARDGNNGRGTVCAVQVINQGDIVIKSEYVGEITGNATWTDGENDENITKLGKGWGNGTLSTLTLTNTAVSTLTFGAATTGQTFTVVSEEGSALTIPATCLDKFVFSMVDFGNAAGGVTIDLAGVAAGEKTLLSWTKLTGTVSFTGAPAGYGAYADATGIHLARTADVTRTNPVTGDSVDFVHSFYGETDGAWGTLANWRKAEDGLMKMPAKVPGVPSGDLVKLMIDGDVAVNDEVTVDTLEGYAIQYAFLNGAKVTAETLTKIQTGDAEQFIWVDEDSSFTVNALSNNANWGSLLRLYVAAADGIKFPACAKSVNFNYYLKGAGSVKFDGALTAGTHKIAQLDIDVGDNTKTARSVKKSAALVTLGEGSSVTFGAADDIVAKSSDAGVTPVYTNVMPNATMAVGTYTIATEADGVYAYVVQYSDTWDIVDPLTATLEADATFGDIEWTDACGQKYVTPAAAHAFTLDAGAFKATFDDKVVTGSSIALKGGTLEVATADIVTNATLTIDEGATLSVKASGLVASKVTNNGTIAFAGGTAEDPIVVTCDGAADADLGKYDIAAGYVKTVVNGNKCFNVEGAAADSSYLVVTKTDGGYGFTEGSNFTNLTLVAAGAAGHKMYFERPESFNATVNVEVGEGGAIFVYDKTYVIGSLTGNGPVTKLNGPTVTITPGAEATYTGTSSVPFVIAGTARETLSGVYTDALLTVNEGATATISGEAMPRSIANSGTLDMDLAATYKLTADNDGTINLGGNDLVIMEGVEEGTINTTGTGKVYYGFVMDINDCGRFDLTGKYTAQNVKLYDGAGAEIAFTDKGDYLEFDWGITGKNCWWDYEFNGSLANTGTDTTQIGKELTDPYYNSTSNALRVGYATPWTGVNAYPEEFTAVLYGKMVNHTNHVEMAFGSTTDGTKVNVAIACGDPVYNEVKIIISSAFVTKKTVTMSVPNAYTADHLYAFVCKTVTEGETEKTKVIVYLDGIEWDSYTFDEKVTLGKGFQIGSVHGAVPSGCVKANTSNENADLDWLRVYNTVLTGEAMAKYAEEYKYQSTNGNASRTFDDALDQTWVTAEADKAWSVTPYEGEAYTTNIPPASALLTVNATAAATVTVNLDEAATYEQLKVTSGSDITLKKGGTVMPTVSGLTSVGANLTVDYGAINIGKVMVTAGKTLTFDFADFDISGIFATTSYEVTGAATLGEGATIVAANLPAATAARTVTFGLNEYGHYAVTVTVDTATPFVFTIAQGEETGTWTFGGEGVTQATVDANQGIPVWKEGDGTMTGVVINRTYFVKEGTMVAGEAAGKTGTVTIENGAIFDFNGKDDGYIAVNLNGGSLVNNGGDMVSGHRQMTGIALAENSTIGGTGNFGLVSSGYGANTLALGGKTLTKTGDNTFWLTHTTVTNGTLNVTAGTVEVIHHETTFTADAILSLGEGTTLNVGDKLNIAAITANGATINNTYTAKPLAFTLTGSATLTGNGNWGTNTLDNAAAATIGTKRGLTFAGEGTVNVTLTEAEFNAGQATLFTPDEGATISAGKIMYGGKDIADKCTVSDGTITAIDREAKIGTTYYLTLADALGAAQADETVTLLKNVSIAVLAVPEDVTLDLNNFGVQTTAVVNNGTIVVYNLETATALKDIEGTLKAGAEIGSVPAGMLYPINTTVSLEKEEVVSPGHTNVIPHTSIVVGGDDDTVLYWGQDINPYQQVSVTGNAAFGGNLCAGWNEKLTTKLSVDGDLMITKSVIISNWAEMVVSGAVVKYAGTETIALAGLDTKFVNDGALVANEDVISAVDGYKVFNGNGTYTLGVPEAKIGDKFYKTLAEAFAAAADDDTIVLQKDCEVAAKISIDPTKDITLDANGKTVTVGAGVYAFVNGGAVETTGTGTFTVTGNGTFYAPTAAATCFLWARRGNVVVENGSFSMDGSAQCVYVNNGCTATINGGTFVNRTGADVLNVANGEAVTQIQCYGGSYSKDPATGDDVLKGSFVADGYESKLNAETGLYDVTEKSGPAPVPGSDVKVDPVPGQENTYKVEPTGESKDVEINNVKDGDTLILNGAKIDSLTVDNTNGVTFTVMNKAGDYDITGAVYGFRKQPAKLTAKGVKMAAAGANETYTYSTAPDPAVVNLTITSFNVGEDVKCGVSAYLGFTCQLMRGTDATNVTSVLVTEGASAVVTNVPTTLVDGEKLDPKAFYKIQVTK